MSIQKKSLISALQSTKKANIAKETVGTDVASKTSGLKPSPVMKLRSNLVSKAAIKSLAAKKAARK